MSNVPSVFHKAHTISCKGRLIDLSRPKVMGILNLTPDSFHAGSRVDVTASVDRAGKMLDEGATFLDLGGYSSRPGADDISVDIELERVIPAIRAILSALPDALISVDTFRSVVAEEAVKAGAAIVNDISAGLLDDKMLETIGKYDVPYVMMHMRGTPQTMKNLTDYTDLQKEVLEYFSGRIRLAREKGVSDIIIDPGFGFAKTQEQNFELLRNLEALKITGLPLLAGISRKSMVTKTLGISSADALNGTTVLNTIALTKGANILRVHDVKEAVEAVRLWEATEGLGF
jgi:dihydropteroate synthase